MCSLKSFPRKFVTATLPYNCHTTCWPENKWHKLEGKDLNFFSIFPGKLKKIKLCDIYPANQHSQFATTAVMISWQIQKSTHDFYFFLKFTGFRPFILNEIFGLRFKPPIFKPIAGVLRYCASQLFTTLEYTQHSEQEGN